MTDDLPVSREFQALLDAAVDAIVMIDERGAIRLWNNSAERLFGFARDEVVGRNVSMLMTSGDRFRHDDYLERYYRTHEPHIIGIGRDVEAVHKDGTIFPVRISVGQVAGAAPSRYIGILHDLTHQRQSERQLQQMQNRMTNVARLATMGELAAAIAHEINQPLTAIASYAQAGSRLLTEEPPAIDDTRVALKQIGQQALRSGEIIRRLRSLLRQQETDREPSDVSQLIQELSSLLAADARLNDVRLLFELERDLPSLLIDRVQIQQVIVNLVRNAIEATDSLPAVARKVIIRARPVEDGEIEVSVTDSGSGVLPEMLPRMFDPFATSKATGTGLGLSISRSIVGAHRGQLGYRPAPGGGACFYFRLPVG